MRSDHTWCGEVIIAGAGPAGSICATLLARLGKQVLLVDTLDSNRWRPTEVFAPATMRILRQHGLPTPEKHDDSAICRGVLGLWGGAVDFFDYELLACDAGATVNRQKYDAKLIVGAKSAGVLVHSESRIKSAVSQKNGIWAVRIAVGNNTSIAADAPLFIDASGRHGAIQTSHQDRRDYFDRLVALAVPLALKQTAHQIMLLEASATGWWYSSCDFAGRGAAVFLTDADLIPQSSTQRERFFREQFVTTKLLGSKLPNLPEQIRPLVIDARTSCRLRLSARNSIAVGDAAYSVDPLSGGGIRRAIDMAVHAAQAANNFLAQREESALAAYEAWATTDFEHWLRTKDAVYAEAAHLFRSEFWRRRTPNLQ